MDDCNKECAEITKIGFSSLFLFLKYKIEDDIKKFKSTGNTILTLSDIDKLKNMIRSISGYENIVKDRELIKILNILDEK